jgi:hypothetical protein
LAQQYNQEYNKSKSDKQFNRSGNKELIHNYETTFGKKNSGKKSN